MKNFLAVALPFYGMAALALVAYVILFKLQIVDMNAVAKSMSSSPFFAVFVFGCVLAESVFPYFLYFPGTILLLLSLTVAPPGTVDWRIFVFAWAAELLGAFLSYVQARFFRGLLKRVASRNAIAQSERLFDSYGSFASLGMLLHPNYVASFFTALGLLKRKIGWHALFLPLAAAVWLSALYFFSAKLLGESGAADDGTLQLLLAFGCLVFGTAAGVRAALRGHRPNSR